MDSPFIYTGNNTKEISFPLGGLGTGCIGLAGNGRLIDWEIFNKPNKGSYNGFSHFAVKAEANGKVLDARVLQGALLPPYTGALSGQAFGSFGFGPPRYSMAGAPNFSDFTFTGEYPIARIDFLDGAFPGEASITAFNPFIPLNDKDSGIPAAFFETSVRNTSAEVIEYTFALSVNNPFPLGSTVNTFAHDGEISRIHFTQEQFEPDQPGYGDLSIATDAADVSYQEYWFRGSWFDNLGVYWQDLTEPRPFKNRSYSSRPKSHANMGREDMGLLAVRLKVEPGETGSARFVIGWNFPNCINYWTPECSCGGAEGEPTVWKNWYAQTWQDSTESTSYALTNWDRLFEETNRFKNLLFSSTLPSEVIDAVSANISILKSPTVMRLEDGTFYGFEGCHPASGCCEGSCTHVWNYAYALPFLFPALERSMRDADYAFNIGEDGDMTFRLQLPLGRERIGFRPCADGQLGGILKCYREWKISGDDSWLKTLWPQIKRSLEWAWSPNNPDRWDPYKRGVLTGRQHHTLDMELFGPNSWLTGFYLTALKAAAEIARYFGEEEKADEYQAIFERGKEWVDKRLFNGEYYQQQIELKDRSVLASFDDEDIRSGKTIDAYWNEEHGQIKYQIGDGCIIDQVLAQWHANNIGLGEVFDPAKTRSALRSIYRYNFKQRTGDSFNPCRLFSLNDEPGLVICSFPKKMPYIPIPYAEETMYGFEYQAACHMIQAGLVDEGLEVVRAVRGRMDGERRNPWNEFECGSNYARSMASYALLTTISGFEFDMTKSHMGFKPLVMPDRDAASMFRCFYCLDGAWGFYEQEDKTRRIEVSYGELTLSSVRVPGIRKSDNIKAATAASTSVLCSAKEDGVVRFAEPIRLITGEELVITLA